MAFVELMGSEHDEERRIIRYEQTESLQNDINPGLNCTSLYFLTYELV